MNKNRDEFLPRVRKALAERSGHMCSSPNCNRLTIGPSEADPELSHNVGKAAHICAAAENGPRYDKNQDPIERMDIENGIWLCSHCAEEIDKNKGLDYPKDVLVAWKVKHEKMIKSLIKSGSSPLALARKTTTEAKIASDVLVELDNKAAFFASACFENHKYVVLSLKEARDYLSDKLKEIDSESRLYADLHIINEACREYMNNTSNGVSPFDMEVNLAVMRKKIGTILRSISNQFGVKIPSNLSIIVPQ